MRKYDLAEMLKARGKLRGERLLPTIQDTPAFSRAYLARLRKFLVDISKITREIVVTSYAQSLNDTTVDVSMGDFERLRRIVDNLKPSVFSDLENMISREVTRHTDVFMRSAKRVFGVDLKGIVSAEQLDDFVEQVALRNAGLVTGMSDDLIKRIQTLTMTSVIEGKTVKSLRSELKREFEISDSRARLIARDQTAKLNADLNEKRQTQAGVTEYYWRTSRDERVRSRHRAISNRKYKYGKPTGAEQGLPPGKPIQCRCIAQGIIK